MDPVAKAVIANITGKLATKRKIESHPCEMCGVDCCTADQLTQHLDGQKHQKRMKVLEKQDRKAKQAEKGTISLLQDYKFRCDMCRVQLNSERQFALHMVGNRHQRMLDRKKGLGQDEEDGSIPGAGPSPMLFGVQLGKPLIRQNFVKPEEQAEASSSLPPGTETT